MTTFAISEEQAEAFDNLPRQAGAAIKFWRALYPSWFGQTGDLVSIERLNRTIFRISYHARKLTKRQIREGRALAKFHYRSA